MTDMTCGQTYTHYASDLERDGMTFWAIVKRWHDRWQDRQRLARMTDHQLDDIGLTRRDVAVEIHKPFWRA